MMRILTFLLIGILMSPSIVFSEVTRKIIKNPDGTTHIVFYSEGKEIAKEILDKDNNVIKTIGKIPDGIVNEYADNGKIKYKRYFKNGELEGVNKEYYESGKLKAEWNYKNGNLEGTSKEYYESGKLKFIKNFKNDKLEGTGNAYYESGKLKLETNYKNGKPEDTTKIYYENGNLKSELNFKNGNLQGLSKEYYENGNLNFTITYENGQKIKMEEYEPDGKLKSQRHPSLKEKEGNRSKTPF